jgi:hypothetical protein
MKNPESVPCPSFIVISTGFSFPVILKTWIPFDLTAAALLGLQLYLVSFA